MKRKIRMILLACLVGTACLFSVHAQEDMQGQGVDSEKEGMVSFDFKDADVRNVLRIFSHKTGINIVASPDVVGSVTVKLNNVPWEKALKIILEMNDFAYVREENVIKVLTRDRIAQEPLKTEVIALDYAKAQQVLPTVENMLSERGSIQTDARANLLIVTDVSASFDPIKKVIRRLDMPTPQVLIETKIVETTMNFQKKFGVRWDFLDEFSLGYGGDGEGGSFSKLREEETGNAWAGTRSKTRDYGTMTEEFGVRYDENNPDYELGYSDPTQAVPDQWAIKVDRNELPTYNHNDWYLSTGEYTKGFGDTLTDTLSSIDNVTKTFNTIITASSFNAVMSALLTDDGTDVLSSPSVVTMDNKKAVIKVSSDFPMPSYSYNDDTGQYEITGFTPTPIGITLEVTPYVAPNGYVTMELLPVVSRIDREVPFVSLGANIPQIGKQTVETTVMVKDGDTVVLGGLMKQDDSYNNQKVPLLHSIPVLGWLFKYKEKGIDKRNLLIFVTPTIMKKENVQTITQNKADWYTKSREGWEEPTTIYPNLES